MLSALACISSWAAWLKKKTNRTNWTKAERWREREIEWRQSSSHSITVIILFFLHFSWLYSIATNIKMKQTRNEWLNWKRTEKNGKNWRETRGKPFNNISMLLNRHSLFFRAHIWSVSIIEYVFIFSETVFYVYINAMFDLINSIQLKSNIQRRSTEKKNFKNRSYIHATITNGNRSFVHAPCKHRPNYFDVAATVTVHLNKYVSVAVEWY